MSSKKKDSIPEDPDFKKASSICDPNRKLTDEEESQLRFIESLSFRTIDSAMDFWQNQILNLAPCNPFAIHINHTPQEKEPYSIRVDRKQLFNEEARERDSRRAWSNFLSKNENVQLLKRTRQEVEGKILLRELRKDGFIDVHITSEMEEKIHTCSRCKNKLSDVILYCPVISFGDTNGKKVLIVGINPSTREFEDGYLNYDRDVEKRHRDQLTYFDRPYYGYFFGKIESFFEGEPSRLLDIEKSIWEKVGFLDLVKCPTRNGKRQWSQIIPSKKRTMIENCETFLLEQLMVAAPEVIVAYGADVCRWFSLKLNVNYQLFSVHGIDFFGKSIKLLMIPQKQGGYSGPELSTIRKMLTDSL